MALSRPRLRAQYVGQERLRRAFAVQDVVFAAFLKVHDELHGDPRIARPARIGRVTAVTIEIPGVSGFGHLRRLEADFLRAVPQHGLAEGRQILQT